MEKPQLHMLHTCPFCWKVRSIAEHLDIDYQKVQVNAMKTKKELKFAGDWGKVPVWTEVGGDIVVDSTPIMKHIDVTYNDGKLWETNDAGRRDEWMEWVDTKMSKATVPILYGGLFSALQTTIRVSKLEKFGFISKRLYAWAGFPIMWGFIARSRVKKDGRKPKQLWHDLLTEFTDSFNGEPYFGGAEPDMVDLAAFGYMRSISPFPQFKKLEDHENGMNWYQRVEASIQK
ncbi:MAG: glutathione S-transferase N-terminal domain-containing protein [Candidatus Thalassarchaeaceae archaeon]|nr:glutathione S-transferase N-terminal domain-containing protein [Candidatus Thalassarchaeaceae archaeon]